VANAILSFAVDFSQRNLGDLFVPSAGSSKTMLWPFCGRNGNRLQKWNL